MPDAGRPKSPLTLSVGRADALSQLAAAPRTSAAMRLRARIVLASAEGRSNKEVADLLKVTPGTVGKWRRRFLRMGMAGLDDGMRSGRPRMVDRVQLGAVGYNIDGRFRTSPVNSRTGDGVRRLAVDGLAAAPGGDPAPPLQCWNSRGDRPSRSAAVDRDTELLSDRVYEAIRGWILSGELAPGMRVVESEIARVLGTSQTPAREAVRRLAHEGLVTYRPRLGNFVTEISQVEAREAREVRVLLESAAARRATGHAPPEELDLLRIEVQRMIEAAGHHDIGAFREADLRFHRQVLATSGNSMLLRVWRTLEPALWSLQVVSNAMYAGDWGLMARRHLDLIEVLAGTDPEDSARLFAAHARGESSITRPAGRHA